MDNSLLNKLNEEQQKAVLQTEGPVLILAGAGSGKTRVITHRIAYLVLNKNISPYNICAVTFTNKAAAEMRERIHSLLPNSHQGLTIKTFHSLCLYILRSNVEKIGRSSNFTVYDTSLQESLLKEIIKSFELDPKKFQASQIGNQINKYKDAMLPLEEFGAELRKDSANDSLIKIFQEYEKRKIANNAMDFGDLIYKTVDLFQKNPDVIQKYNSYWKYIMVDEYQDTNKVQYILTKLLAGTQKNICVVGDDDQSIYSWRGADIRNILDFEKDFQNTFTIKLEENYRSSANIISAASSLIKNNSERKNKKIFSNKEDGEKISYSEFYSENEESNSIISDIGKLYKGNNSYSNFAIFYRTNAQSRYFEEALRSRNIPYKIFGGFRFFDRAEIKDLVAYLSVIVNPNDNLSLKRIINTPPRGIGDTTIERLQNFAIDHQMSLLESLNENISEIRKAGLLKLKELYNKFEKLQKEFLQSSVPSVIVRELLEVMGIIDYYKQDASVESNDRLENIEQFLAAIEEYQEQTENPNLAEYLNNITLLTSEENNQDVKDYVTLMTVHNSKGLEFEYVFLSGMEEGTFPHSMSLNTEKEVEEERRLCYVAITRAKQKLSMSYCKVTRKFGMTESRMPSRFFSEIPEELFQFEIKNSPYTNSNNSYSAAAGNRIQNESLDSKKRSIEINSTDFKVGDRVKHKDFGIGRILEVSGKGDNRMVRVSYGFNQKKFLLAYTKLEIVN